MESRDGQWPEHLRPGAVRFSWSSAHYDETIAFYRDLLGLPVIEQFSGSFGEDGTILGLPGVPTHVEIVRAHRATPLPDPLDQLVFYLPGAEAMAAATQRLRDAGVARDPDPHPYWVARGAAIHLDPDGRRVVFAPWVFGAEPEPNSAS
jgi:catechol 2,3-dioxygenase-like lactoylglutathione lyase family enzyme